MALYHYRIVNQAGKSQSGIITAETEFEAATTIKELGGQIVTLKVDVVSNLFTPFKKTRVSALDRIIFTEHLAAMIRSGTPILEALETFQEEKHTTLHEVITHIMADVETGKSLSVALKAYSHIFSPLYCALVEAGEVSGTLETALGSIAMDLRREFEFNERVKSALMYPALVLGVAVVVISGLIMFVIPQITQITRDFTNTLPLSTRIVSSIAVWLSEYGMLVIAAGILGILGLVVALSRPVIKSKFDAFILKIPLIGDLIKKYSLNRFLRTLGGCLTGGIPLLQSLQVIAGIMDNRVFRQITKRIENRISKGNSLYVSLVEEKQLFPSVVSRMVKGAEKTGTVGSALLQLSEFYETEIDRDLKRLTQLIEPIMVIVLGIIVAAIAIAVIAPIYQLTSQIK